MYDVSVLIPGIRTHQWKTVLDTLAVSCKKYKYEVVFVGPFDPPAECVLENVVYHKSYASPSVSAQIGGKLCRGELLLHNVDDAHFIHDSVDKAVDLYKKVCGRKDVINLCYTEDDNFSGKTNPPEYWYAHHHEPLRLPGIPVDYKLALHFLVNREYFLEMGGFDCSYEYLNLNLHDLMFRIQYDGGKIYDAPSDVTNCNHYGGRSVDHGPIHDAYGHDIGIFNQKYVHPHALNSHTNKINYDHWKSCPEVWGRRFKKLYTSYAEMIADQ